MKISAVLSFGLSLAVLVSTTNAFVHQPQQLLKQRYVQNEQTSAKTNSQQFMSVIELDDPETSSSSSSSSSPSVMSRRSAMTTSTFSAIAASFLTMTAATGVPQPAVARLESVNRPELLPKEPGQNVIQIEKFLTSGQAKRMDEMLRSLERDTGFRVRVLCQSYPNTPGLAIRDYWDLGKEVRIIFIQSFVLSTFFDFFVPFKRFISCDVLVGFPSSLHQP